MIRLLIADDRSDVRRALRAVLSLQPDISLEGEAADGASAVSEAVLLRPNVALLDIQMPGLDGITAAREIRRLVPRCRVVVFSLYDSQAFRAAALAAGAHGFVSKASAPRFLLQAIRDASASSP